MGAHLLSIGKQIYSYAETKRILFHAIIDLNMDPFLIKNFIHISSTKFLSFQQKTHCISSLFQVSLLY